MCFAPPACFRRCCPSITHHYSLTFILSLTADLFSLIIHANSESLYVYLIIFQTFDRLLKAVMFAYIANCLELLPYCGKIMEIAGDKKGGEYTLECFCCTVSLSSYPCVKTFRSSVFLLSFRFFLVWLWIWKEMSGCFRRSCWHQRSCRLLPRSSLLNVCWVCVCFAYASDETGGVMCFCVVHITSVMQILGINIKVGVISLFLQLTLLVSSSCCPQDYSATVLNKRQRNKLWQVLVSEPLSYSAMSLFVVRLLTGTQGEVE